VAAAALMVMGISLLGLLAGTLASFFRLTPPDQRRAPDQTGQAGAATPGDAGSDDPAVLAEQIAALRTRLHELEQRLSAADAPETPRRDT
jgi:hypothetical protein